MSDKRRVAVGEPYAGCTSWLEGCEFNWTINGLELALRLAGPTAEEVEAARAGHAEFALAVEEGVIFLLYQFGGGRIPWSDAPFSIHLVPATHRAAPPVMKTADSRLVLQVVLLDSQTGIVRAIRAVSLSRAFSQVLASAMAAQEATPFAGRSAHDAAVGRVYAQCPETEDLLARTVVRCTGGE